MSRLSCRTFGSICFDQNCKKFGFLCNKSSATSSYCRRRLKRMLFDIQYHTFCRKSSFQKPVSRGKKWGGFMADFEQVYSEHYDAVYQYVFPFAVMLIWQKKSHKNPFLKHLKRLTASAENASWASGYAKSRKTPFILRQNSSGVCPIFLQIWPNRTICLKRIFWMRKPPFRFISCCTNWKSLTGKFFECAHLGNFLLRGSPQFSEKPKAGRESPITEQK